MMGLTPAQARLLAFLEAEMRRAPRVPTRRGAAVALGVKSFGGLANMLDDLEARGAFCRIRNARGERLAGIPWRTSKTESEE